MLKLSVPQEKNTIVKNVWESMIYVTANPNNNYYIIFYGKYDSGDAGQNVLAGETLTIATPDITMISILFVSLSTNMGDCAQQKANVDRDNKNS